jgi:hypothetical protein
VLPASGVLEQHPAQAALLSLADEHVASDLGKPASGESSTVDLSLRCKHVLAPVALFDRVDSTTRSLLSPGFVTSASSPQQP